MATSAQKSIFAEDSSEPVAKKVRKTTTKAKAADSAEAPKTEKTTAKKAATPRKKAVKASTAAKVSPEQRYEMIATAAYFIAEKRGFSGGYEMNDWISAEAEIDLQLKG